MGGKGRDRIVGGRERGRGEGGKVYLFNLIRLWIWEMEGCGDVFE